MNDLLQLKGHFESRKNSQSFGARKLPGNDINESVSLENIEKISSQLIANGRSADCPAAVQRKGVRQALAGHRSHNPVQPDPFL